TVRTSARSMNRRRSGARAAAPPPSRPAGAGSTRLTSPPPPPSWRRAARALLGSLARAPLPTAGVALLLLGALWLRRPMQHRLHHLAEQARAPMQVSIAPTLEAVGISLAFVPWGPALLAYLGWRLSVSPDATQFVRSVAHGMLGAAAIWLTLEVPRQLVRRDGPAAAHFTWPEAAAAELRREICWITAVAVPLLFLI